MSHIRFHLPSAPLGQIPYIYCGLFHEQPPQTRKWPPLLILHPPAPNLDDVLDILLDQEGLEIDELDRMEKDTPLHKAVRFVNSLAKEEWENGAHIVDILVDAGCDPRIRNKAKLRPFDLVDPRNTELRKMLQKAEFAMMAGGDVVEEDDDGPTGSGSESD